MRESLKLRQIAAPQQLPVSLGEARAQLRLDEDASEEDAVLASMLHSAVGHAEAWTGRALITQRFELFLDHLPARALGGAGADFAVQRKAIFLPRPPLQAVIALSVFDVQGVETAIAASAYFIDAAGAPGRLILDGSLLPGALRAANAIRIEFDAGYGDDPQSVPEDLQQGILQLTAHLFENRGACGLEDAAKLSRATGLFAPFRVVRL